MNNATHQRLADEFKIVQTILNRREGEDDPEIGWAAEQVVVGRHLFELEQEWVFNQEPI